MSVRICCALLLLVLAAFSFGQEGSVITEIVINGNKRVNSDSIKARMRTQVGQPYVQGNLDADRAAIEQMGYFEAVTVQAQPLQGNNWRVLVEVKEFEEVKEIRVVGNTVIPTEKILEIITIKPGQIFNLTELNPSGDAIAKYYADRGYLALVEDFGPLQESPSTINIAIREMKVNSVNVQGVRKTSERVMKRLIKTKPGDVYNVRKWDDDLRRIFSTQWFEKVDPTERVSEDGTGFDLLVDLKETKTGNVIFGVTLDPRSSFAGQIRLFDTNFRGTGQTIGVNFLQAVSGGGASVELDYTNPFIDNRDTSLTVSLYSRILYRFTNTGFDSGGSPTDERFSERRTGGALSLQRPVADRTFVSAGLRYEDIRTSNLNAQDPNSFIQQDGQVGVLQLGYLRNRRDLDMDPSRGDWLSIAFEPGFSNITKVGGALPDTSILGRNTFLRNTIEYRTYFTDQPPRGRQLDAPRRVLALRARYGIISGTVPFAEQYFIGGSDTLRGYDDDRFWGKQALLLTAEYRYPIMKSFNAIAFVDYGGAWGGYGTVNNFTQSSRPNLHLGYGLGVSFKTPLGPIRLDFGFNDRGGSRTHFLIGTSF